MKSDLAVVILAAGKGTRMESDKPKVLHKIDNKSLIEHVVLTTKKLFPQKIIVVVGYKFELIKENLKKINLNYALQEQQNGTGHAVMQCHEQLKKFDGNTLILSGDVPLINYETLQRMHDAHIKTQSAATILTADFKNPFGYGRIIKKNDDFSFIKEEKDATKEEKEINEINAGIYIFNNKTLFKHIKRISNNNNQKEYYLPDVFPFIIKNKQKVSTFKINNNYEIKGINTINQLNELNIYAKKI